MNITKLLQNILKETSPYLYMIDKNKEKLADEIRNETTPDQIFSILNMIDDFFDKEYVFNYINELDEGHKEIMVEMLINSIYYDSIKQTGIIDKVDEFEIIMEDDILHLIHKETGNKVVVGDL